MGIGTFRDIFGHRLCPDSSAFDILSIFNVIRKRAVSMRPLTTSTVATCLQYCSDHYVSTTLAFYPGAR